MSRPKTGSIRKLPSGRFATNYTGPDGKRRTLGTFASRPNAVRALRLVHSEMERGEWTDPGIVPEKVPTLGEFATAWLKHRAIRESTRKHYRALYAQHIEPQFGEVPITEVTPRTIGNWHRDLCPDAPASRAQSYALLRTILSGAVDEEWLPANPARIRGASSAKRRTSTELPEVAQIAALMQAMPAGKYRCMALVAAWCGLRFGEVTELRRGDVVFARGGAVALPVSLRVRRGVYRGVVGEPKTDAGIREVSIPRHVQQPLADYLRADVPVSRDSLLFPGTRNGEHMAPSSLYKVWYPAREKVGLPTLRWHDLRHFNGTLSARTGASMREVQARLGHASLGAAMRYQHAAQSRDAVLAEGLSRLAEGTIADVLPLPVRHADDEADSA